jgi:hypothetical protein
VYEKIGACIDALLYMCKEQHIGASRCTKEMELLGTPQFICLQNNV